MANFKPMDRVRRFFASSGRVSKTIYVVVKVEGDRIWVSESLEGSGGMKPYAAKALVLVS